MSASPYKLSFYSPGVQSVLPMFYVAWSDRLLSPSEIRLLKEELKNISFLTDREKVLLRNWMRPSLPPSRELYKLWEIEVQEAVSLLEEDEPHTLTYLGLEMAKRAMTEMDEQAQASLEEMRKVLEAVEARLKPLNSEICHQIFDGEEVHEQEELAHAQFDIAAMNKLLGAEQTDLIQRVKAMLNDPVFERTEMPVKEDYREQVLHWTKLLAAQGWGALNFPKQYGGKDSMLQYAAVFETLGYFDLSLAIKFGVQFGLFGGSVMSLGTKKHHDEYLTKIGTSELLGCFAMTETGHGSNVRKLETTATYSAEKDSIIIHSPRYEAGKEYIGNALHGRMASVFCQLIVDGENHGIHAVLVPLRDENDNLLPGIKVEDNGYKMGLNGVDNGRIWFDHVEVPRENLLDRFGGITEEGKYHSDIENPSRRFFTMLGTLVGGRVCVPRCGLSAAKAGIEIAVRFGLKRRQFGPNFTAPETLILDYPSHQRRLMPLVAKAYALHFGLQYLTERFSAHEEGDMREIETLAAGMKAYATWFTTHALQESREACGGKGYLSENRFDHLKNGTEIFTTFEGDNTVLMQLVAKGVLTKYRQAFNEEGMFGMLRYLGGMMASSVIDKNPITIRRTEREHLLDHNLHLQLFRSREENLKYSVSQRMRGLIKQGKSGYDAAIECQTHMLALATAFIERIVLEQFVQVVEDQENEALKASLQQLCQLYALHTIEEHKGWYLEQAYMDGSKSKAIRRIVDDLCVEVREDALALVEAWGISEELLGAPIAH